MKGLKPVLFWLSLMGIPSLITDPTHYSIKKVIIKVIGYLILISNVALNCLQLIRYFIGLIDVRLQLPYNRNITVFNPEFLYEIIGYLAYLILIVGTHLAFGVVSLMCPIWSDLWAYLQEIQLEMDLGDNFHKLCQRLCFFVMSLSILDSTVYYFSDPDERYLKNNDIFGKINRNIFPDSWSTVFGHYYHWLVISIHSIFLVLVLVTALLYRELTSRISTIANIGFRLDTKFLHMKLEEWRHHYELVGRLVEKINNCFGPVLVIFISHTFVECARECAGFADVNHPRQHHQLSLTSFASNLVRSLTPILARFLVLVMGSCHMHGQAVSSGDSLRLLQPFSYDNTLLQVQLSTITLQVVKGDRPKITVMDIINFDMTIIQMLIGTTVSYAVIMHQGRKYAEKTSGSRGLRFLQSLCGKLTETSSHQPLFADCQ